LKLSYCFRQSSKNNGQLRAHSSTNKGFFLKKKLKPYSITGMFFARITTNKEFAFHSVIMSTSIALMMSRLFRVGISV